MLSTKLFKEFVSSERSGAFVLMFATAVSLLLANSLFGETLQHFFHMPILGMPIEKWVNDGLIVNRNLEPASFAVLAGWVAIG